MTLLWLSPEQACLMESHPAPPCALGQVIPASLSFNFWICKLGMVVASTSRCCSEEKSSLLTVLQGTDPC